MRYWVVGEFTSGPRALEALRALRARGYAKERLDAYSPYPLEGAEKELGLPPSGIRGAAFLAGLTGAAFGYAVQWYCNALDFPINAGGRPPHAAPAFVPITFESMVLFAAVTIFFGLMFLFRFPRPHHPLFELESFRSVSTGGFWISITTEERQERDALFEQLRALEPRTASVVEEKT